MHRYTRFYGLVLLLGTLPILGCGGDDPSGPDRGPEISVAGVEDGDTLQGPVTITITVDRGAFSAVLNGMPFLSGQSVTAPGDYTLVVTAQDGASTSTLELEFRIVLTGESRLIVRFFDLGDNDAGGGGDAILITDSSSAGSMHALVDAGPAGAGGADPGFVARRLLALGVDTLETLVLTHAHADHFTGIPAVLDQAWVKTFVWNGQVRSFSEYSAVIADARTSSEAELQPTSETSFDLGFGDERSRLVLIPPLATHLSDGGAGSSELNDGSIGGELTKAGFRMFLTGDGEVAANQRWRVQFPARTGSLTVLKVGHHGANDAVFDNGFDGASTWLGHADPEVAVVSANGTSHPRINATSFLLARPRTRVYCTNVHGDIEIRVGEDGAYAVTVERNQSADCEPGSQATT